MWAAGDAEVWLAGQMNPLAWRGGGREPRFPVQGGPLFWCGGAPTSLCSNCGFYFKQFGLVASWPSCWVFIVREIIGNICTDVLALQLVTGTFAQGTLPAPSLGLAAQGTGLNCKVQACQETGGGAGRSRQSAPSMPEGKGAAWSGEQKEGVLPGGARVQAPWGGLFRGLQ